MTTKKENHIVHFAPTNDKNKNFEVHTFNLGSIHPHDYKKIEFLGNVGILDGWGSKVSWGGMNFTDVHRDYGKYGAAITDIKGENVADLLKKRNNILRTVILHKKVTNKEEADNYALLNCQVFEERGSFGGWLGVRQKLGFTWYQENGNYYLQVIVFQYIDWRASFSELNGWIKIGNGVRLYND